MNKASMRAWAVDHPGGIDSSPLQLREVPLPTPGIGQIRAQVHTCGVCGTGLHVAEGDLAPKHDHITPGHEVVGTVDLLGEGTTRRFHMGDRVGIAWLGRTCDYCVAGKENLCFAPMFTGWDVDGGYADFGLVHDRANGAAVLVIDALDG